MQLVFIKVFKNQERIFLVKIYFDKVGGMTETSSTFLHIQEYEIKH
jgi:predicted metalloprotease with PDZ domain